MIYGYARCSTNEELQDINRQIRELKQLGAAEETIYREYESGTKMTVLSCKDYWQPSGMATRSLPPRSAESHAALNSSAKSLNWQKIGTSNWCWVLLLSIVQRSLIP